MNNRVADIDARIEELTEELSNVKGTQTEIYSRIVGYYRSVKNWNRGKREEWGIRTSFVPTEAEVSSTVVKEESKESLSDDNQMEVSNDSIHVESESNEAAVQDETNDGLLFDVEPAKPSSFSFFFREQCPNCPPVKDFLHELSFDGNWINVDSQEGLDQAVKMNVYTAPTVIFFDSEGHEIFRADNILSLREYADSALCGVA